MFLTSFSAKILARISHLEDKYAVAVGLVKCTKSWEIEGQESFGIMAVGLHTLPVFSLTSPARWGGQQSLSQSGNASYATGYSVSDIEPGKSFKTASV